MEKITTNTRVKSRYEIYQHISGYYSICLKGTAGDGIIYGGDSAHEPDYDKSYIMNIWKRWTGRFEKDGKELILKPLF